MCAQLQWTWKDFRREYVWFAWTFQKESNTSCLYATRWLTSWKGDKFKLLGKTSRQSYIAHRIGTQLDALAFASLCSCRRRAENDFPFCTTTLQTIYSEYLLYSNHCHRRRFIVYDRGRTENVPPNEWFCTSEFLRVFGTAACHQHSQMVVSDL